MNAQSLKAKLTAGAVVATIALGSASMAFAQPTNSIQAAKRAKDQIEAGTAERAGASTTAQLRQQNSASTTASKREVKRVELKEKLTVKLEEKAKTRVGKTISNRLQKQSKAIQIVGAFITKIEARIATFKARGASTAQSEQLILSAKAKLESAKTKLAAIQLTASTTASSTSPKADLEKMRTALEAVTLDTKAAHKTAVDAIVLLKGMASTTSNTSGQATSTNQ